MPVLARAQQKKTVAAPGGVEQEAAAAAGRLHKACEARVRRPHAARGTACVFPSAAVDAFSPGVVVTACLTWAGTGSRRQNGARVRLCLCWCPVSDGAQLTARRKSSSKAAEPVQAWPQDD